MAKFDAETLIKYATQTEKALTEKTLSALQNLSPDVTLHQEAFTLNHDIKGEAEVKKYLQSYFDQYEFEHDTLNYAVNPDTSCSFALSYDKVSRAVYLYHTCCYAMFLVYPFLRLQGDQPSCGFLPTECPLEEQGKLAC